MQSIREFQVRTHGLSFDFPLTPIQVVQLNISLTILSGFAFLQLGAGEQDQKAFE